MSVSVLEVKVAALVTALATGLGALPFASRSPSRFTTSRKVAAGAMAWLVLTELLPDARSELETRSLVIWLGGSLAVMSGLQAALLTH
jgi:zinc transporter ZupT